MPYLITYRSDFRGNIIYGMDTTEDPIEWLETAQQFKETYILINALLISEEQEKRIHGSLKGM